MRFEDALDLPLREVLKHIQLATLGQTTYFGVRAIKSPMDAWVYQQIITLLHPDVIVEVGNASGGGLLYLAHLCDLLSWGKVIGVDISHDALPHQVRSHHRVKLITGGAVSVAPEVISMVEDHEHVLVIEDSSHTYENTLAVLRAYSPLIKPGDYFIVEDGICHHGLDEGPNPGPYEAIETFLSEDGSFYADRDMEQFLITWNPKGYLRKKL